MSDEAAMKRAGQQLRQMRLAMQLTQQDLLMRSGGRLSTSFISRLESGAFVKPPAPDWILYGHLVGLEPNEIARLYDYWPSSVPHSGEEEPTVTRLRHVLTRLPEERRRDLAHIVDFAVAYALSEMAHREEDDNQV